MSLLQTVNTRFNQLSRRERLLVALALWSVLVVLLYLPLESQWQQWQQLQTQTQQADKLRLGNSQQISLLQSRLAQDPNQSLRAQQTALQQQLADLNKQLNSETVDLIPAERMPALLGQLLGQVQGIKLVAFQSIAPTPLLVVGDDSKGQMNLYSHGIALTFEGDYFSVLKFVQAVEQLPQKLYWKGLDYQVQQYPKATVKLNLYTLSINKDFIRVSAN